MTIANESLLEFISENKTKDAIEFNKTLFDSISHRTLYNFKGLKMKLFKEKCITCNKIQQRIGDKISTRCNTCEAAVYYECLICRSQYKYPAGIYTHISLKHTNSDTSKPVKCERCGIEFKAQRNMKEHLRYCKVLPYMKCEFCSMMAKRKNCLRKHILIKHKNDIQAMDIENLLQKIVENSQELRRQAIRRAEIVYGGCTSSRVEPFPIAKHIKLFCKKCNTTFKKLLGMDQRSCRICGAQLFMQCVKCDSIYKFRSSISMHLKSKCVLNDNLVLHCNDCNYITFTKQRLKRHIYRKHMLIKLENYLKCRICSKGFKFKEDLLNRQLNCESLKERICNICRFKTNRRTNLSLHMKNKHTPTKLLEEKMHVDVNVKIVADSIATYCSKCNSYNKPIEKITKCLYCKTPVIYCCKKCNLQKQKYVRMRIHVIRKHGEKIYACTKGCGISFSYLYDCRQHQRFCGKKPHLHCDQCSFKTKYKHTLLAHKRRNCTGIVYTHVPEKKVLCYCYYCDKPFESKIQKLRHVKLCSKTTSFLFCDHCSFRTVFKPVLINHIQSKHGARLFRGINAFHCKNCTKVFRNYFVYSKHIENCRFREKKT
ncbi:PREDICTED: zinc finger protein 43-like [Ceratosolen solmsi marchali]|uniref:Zinc finger protein 43-like n=1 Tax=Ceratosolen solmsi marchali TaxID=326594 RepID=A0AAJ7E2P2_9HYME|nr:PREDICTED: zinc finger protein 43-like [Ceratosolen solmsi marchali]